MTIHSEILLGLANQTPNFLMIVGGMTYAVDNARISYSDVPVTRPTLRGGAYYADKMAFKIKAYINDDSLAPLLSKTMLGPNAEFERIEFLTHAGLQKLRIYAHLTNYAQKNLGLELNLVVMETVLSN